MQTRYNLKNKVAVVTGANRGIGLEVCRQLANGGALVVLTSRDEKKGVEAVGRLAAEGVSVTFFPLDVASEVSVKKMGQFIEAKFGRIDILVNNAGILPDNETPGVFSDRSILETDTEVFLSAFQTNAIGALLVCKALVPLMKKGKYGRIVNVSSMVAQLSTMDSGIPAYRISKVALNAVTRILADELREHQILCNCVSPGWVKTEMGGPEANVSVEEGAKWIVNLACLPSDGPSGQFFRNGQAIEW